jgi:hypothetical protein
MGVRAKNRLLRATGRSLDPQMRADDDAHPLSVDEPTLAVAESTAGRAAPRPGRHRAHSAHGTRKSGWGAERIRGELLKLGVSVSERSIQRYMRAVRPKPALHRGPSWATLQHNHTVWSCDFLQTYDVCFRALFAFFIVDVNSKCVIQIAATRAPTQQWTA